MKTIKGEKGIFPLGKERRRSAFTVILGATMVWCLGTHLMPAQSPVLESEWRGDQFVLRWPVGGTAHVVEQSPNLQPPWSVVSGVAEEVEGRFELGIDAGAQSVMFYRLRPQPFELPSFMGLVQDDQSASLSEVVVGELQLTDESGIFSGEVRQSASGWITVKSMGYATAYVAPSVRRGQTDLVETWLTPYGDQQAVEGSGSARLLIGNAASPELSVTVTPSDFAENPVILGLAEIDPLNVGPLFADRNPETEGYLSHAFALEAVTMRGDPVDLLAGRSLVVTVRDGRGDDPPPMLAWFDPEAGLWQVQPGACERAGPGEVECTIPVMSPLFGLFAPGEAPYLAASDLRGRRSSGDAAADHSYKSAEARMKQRLGELEKLMEQGVPVDVSTDAELQGILDELAQMARDYAAANRTEQGKMKLLITAEYMMLLGRGALAQELISESTEIANEIAQRLLASGDCGRVREMLHAMQQLMLLGGDEALIVALGEKIQQLYRECDLWVGWVRFTSFSSPKHPGLDDLVLQTGGSWSEYHDITMATHAETQVLTGEDHVTINFPEVSFGDPDSECERSISFFGAPSGATLLLKFGGTYDGNVFSVGGLSPGAGASPISVTQRQLFMTKEDDRCIPVEGYPVEIPFPNYYSVLMHGFLESPPITIQEMLDSGIRSQSPFGETITGSERVSNEYPVPNFGRYPFTSGVITWRFIHEKKLLPLDP